MDAQLKQTLITAFAAYLPHKVECCYKGTCKAFLTGLHVHEKYIETTYPRKRNGCIGDTIHFEDHNNIVDMKFKLLLRPFSSEIDQLPTMSTSFYTMLLKEHYDIFGLIELGFAKKK